MATTKLNKSGEWTQTVAEFSEAQFGLRRKANVKKALCILRWELETEEGIRNELAERLAQNQKLNTSEKRHADGFSIIYGNLSESEYRVERLRAAVSAVKSLD